MHPVNPLLNAAQNLQGVPQQVHADIIHCVNNIDVNNPVGSQEYTDYLRNLINVAVYGDDSGGQGLSYLIEVIGTELATLSYIETAIDQVDDNVQIVTTEEVTIPHLPIIQHEALGRAITASHHIMEDWNHAATSGNIDRNRFGNLATVRDQLLDLAHALVTTRDGLLGLLAMLP